MPAVMKIVLLNANFSVGILIFTVGIALAGMETGEFVLKGENSLIPRKEQNMRGFFSKAPLFPLFPTKTVEWFPGK